MTKATKKILLRYVLAPILMVFFLWLIYRQLTAKGDLGQQWQALRSYWHSAGPSWFTLVILLAPVNWFWEAVKWQRVVRYLHPVTLWVSFKAVVTGIAFGMVTPGKLGDFAGRILYVPQRKRVAAAIGTLMTNLIQVAASSTAGMAGVIYFLWHHHSGRWLSDFLKICGLVVILLGILWGTRRCWTGWLLQFRPFRKMARYFRVLKRYDTRDIVFIYGFSLVKYLTYNMQFLLLANLLGAQVPWVAGIFATMMMYWLLMAIPSFMLADISVRGFVAGVVFLETGLALNGVSLLAASYVTWLLNLVLPAVIGSVLMVGIRQKSKSISQ